MTQADYVMEQWMVVYYMGEEVVFPLRASRTWAAYVFLHHQRLLVWGYGSKSWSDGLVWEEGVFGAEAWLVN